MLTPERIVKIALSENPKAMGKAKNRLSTTRMGAHYLLWRAFEEAKEYKDKWDAYKRSPVKYSKPELNLAKEPLTMALEKKMAVHVHCVRADDIITACNLAVDYGLDLTLDHANEEYLVAMGIAKSHLPVITGPDF